MTDLATRIEGLTLRDYFAAQTLTALVPTMINGGAKGGEIGDFSALQAYKIADAMLRAREQSQ